jgi:hypothetical protein
MEALIVPLAAGLHWGELQQAVAVRELVRNMVGPLLVGGFDGGLDQSFEGGEFTGGVSSFSFFGPFRPSGGLSPRRTTLVSSG